MLFRGKTGKLYEIKKSDYKSEKEYCRAIVAAKFQINPVVKIPTTAKQEIITLIKRKVNK